MADDPRPSLPHLRATLVECNPGNVECMKTLVHNCFPVTYKDEFYDKVARGYSEFTRFVTLNDVIVGGISARAEADESSGDACLHVLILLVLEKYRRFGLASKLLKWLLEEAKKSPERFKHVNLHVQKSNQAAVNFYLSQKFVVADEIPGYYTEIESPDALFMRFDL